VVNLDPCGPTLPDAPEPHPGFGQQQRRGDTKAVTSLT
jgi:hypothetical protein